MAVGLEGALHEAVIDAVRAVVQVRTHSYSFRATETDDGLRIELVTKDPVMRKFVVEVREGTV